MGTAKFSIKENQNATQKKNKTLTQKVSSIAPRGFHRNAIRGMVFL